MDANGARFFLLAGPPDLRVSELPARARWDETRESWRLSSEKDPVALAEDETLARSLVEAAPRAIDGLGGSARVEGTAVIAEREDLPAREIFGGASWTSPITDVAIGPDHLVSVASGGVLYVRDAATFGDEREGWHALDPAVLIDPSASLQLWRAVSAPDGGGWAIDRDTPRLVRWKGHPLRNRPRPTPAPGTFRPSPEDPRTFELRIAHSGFDGETPIALACAGLGRVAVLTWRTDDEARVHVFTAEGERESILTLSGARFPFSLAWAASDRLAVLVTNGAAVASDAVVFVADGTSARVLPAGERYPLRHHDGKAFMRSPDGRAHYRIDSAASGASPDTGEARPLVALSLPHRASSAVLVGKPLDSGRADTCWHRLYIEAVLPEGCGIRVALAASDSAAVPAEASFFAHDFGAVAGSGPPIPHGAWVPAVSELPVLKGMLHCGPEHGRAGLFVALVQRAGRVSTRLVGRYLHARITLHGTGRSSPELAAVRAWSSRFSYVREYLPALYHDDPRLERSELEGPASPADFFDRFVSIFEGVLTPIEDRVAESWRLTNPRTAPVETLEWLASWVGRALDPSLPEAVRRSLLESSARLTALRGTRLGLETALEIVSEGGVSRGEIVVLEEFRLRRTWATILGADLANEDDPLLMGLSVSGNSIVGDTLFLGDEHQREFMAVFGVQGAKRKVTSEGSAAAPRDAVRAAGAKPGAELGAPRNTDQALDARDERAVEAMLERTAHRVTVLVMESVSSDRLGHVRRMARAEAPAHVRVRVRTASTSFVVGVAALVGVDTRLGVEPVPESVRLGRSFLGAGDRLKRVPGLHPDVEGEEG